MRKLVPARARSGQEIDKIAQRVLGYCQPAAIKKPQVVDVEAIFEFLLPKLGIESDYQPLENRGIQGYTDSENKVCVVSAELADDPTAASYYRSTMAHEIGHAILHIPEFRRRRQKIISEQAKKDGILHRLPDTEIPIYRNPEWQAHRFAGGLLMPEAAVKKAIAMYRSHEILSIVFEVTPAFVRARLKGLKMLN
ncbi:MAG: ImmA/IrrE family metallo-endopeptidase [Gemmatimonadetes bacterium]|nr:ImmA/IrrE family metallo-endopeptidase [Gemmatimonadota bacterium]